MNEAEDFKDLFKDTQADVNTPNLVTFKTPESVTVMDGGGGDAEDEDDNNKRKGSKRKRKTPPKKKESNRKRKPYSRREPSVLSQYTDIINPPPLSEFIVPDATTPSPQQVEEQQKQEKKLAKKREQLKSSTFFTLTEQGKSENEIKTELKKIDKMEEDDVDFELQKISFTQSQHFTDKVAQLIRDTIGWGADAALKGDNFIKAQFENDKAMKDALQKKLMNHVGLLGLNSQIVLLGVGNVIQGKTKLV